VVRHASYGLLQSNEAPDRPSKSIAMEFITDLPKPEEYDTILVVIDQLTKMSHVVPCSKDLDARQFANFFMKEIVRLHRPSHDILTDWEALCISGLWKEPTGKLEIESRLRMAFNPQTDGQTEWTTAILQQYLRAYIHYQQDDWCGYLLLAEFAYNNGYQETIKNTPFFANYGINPEYEMIGLLIQGPQTKLEKSDSVICIIKKGDGGSPITTKRILRSTPKTRSEPTIRRYGVVAATQHQDHQTIEDIGQQENSTYQNLGEGQDKRI